MRFRLLRCLTLFAGLAAAAAFLAPAARAERVYLKNGHEIEGWIVEETKAQVVIAIIKRGTVGKITIDPAEIDQIDRVRKESLEEALARYKREMELQAQEAARLALVQPSGATVTAAPVASEKPKKSDKVEIPAPTPEQVEKIQQAIEAIGDTRKAGGAGTRRDNGVKALVEVGIPAIPDVNAAMTDGNWYRRMNAARALAGVAAQDRRLKLYEESVPKLLQLLSDGQPFVRIEANGALEAIFEPQKMGFQPPATEELQPSEMAVIDRWTKWWEAEQKKLQK